MSRTTRTLSFAAVCAALALVLAPASASAASGVPAWTRTVMGPAPGTVRTADVFEPDDDNSTAKVATLGVAARYDFDDGVPDVPGVPDIDVARFEATAGVTYRITASHVSTDTDTYMWLGDSADDFLSNDDRQVAPPRDVDSEICYTSTATTTLYVAVGDFYHTGGEYDLLVEEVSPSPPAGTGTRIGGGDRYDVARKVAYARKPGSLGDYDAIIIASGLDRSAADPLAAAGLAGAADAPILLINQSSPTRTLPYATRAAIAALEAARPGAAIKYYLIGGTVSMPTWVPGRIQAVSTTARNATFVRLSGTDRYACAASIAREMRARASVTPTGCLIVNGERNEYFFDAMAAGPIAMVWNRPILLVKRNLSIPNATWSASKGMTVTVVGNDYEVSESVRKAFGSSTRRIGQAGWSSYSRTFLSRYIAEYGANKGWWARDGFILANKLPDALTGGTLASLHPAPLLFSANTAGASAHSEAYIQLSRPTIGPWYAVGGPLSISTPLFSRIKLLTGAPTP